MSGRTLPRAHQGGPCCVLPTGLADASFGLAHPAAPNTAQWSTISPPGARIPGWQSPATVSSSAPIPPGGIPTGKGGIARAGRFLPFGVCRATRMRPSIAKMGPPG